MELPSVQLVGAQKSGTSAIADWLFSPADGGFQRPKVFTGDPLYFSKEVHFFDLQERFKQGVGFYASRFEGKNSMDATPDTLQFPQRVKSVYMAAGAVQAQRLKCIVILREPVTRELSLYNHLVYDCHHLDASERNEWHDQVKNHDGSIMTFDEFVEQTSLPALARNDGPGQSTRHSLYALHLSKWFDAFDRNQILVLSYDELKNNPTMLQSRIQRFLGIEIAGKLKISNSNENERKISIQGISKTTKSRLKTVYSSYNEQLYKLLEENPGPPMEQRPFPRFLEP